MALALQSNTAQYIRTEVHLDPKPRKRQSWQQRMCTCFNLLNWSCYALHDLIDIVDQASGDTTQHMTSYTDCVLLCDATCHTEAHVPYSVSHTPLCSSTCHPLWPCMISLLQA